MIEWLTTTLRFDRPAGRTADLFEAASRPEAGFAAQRVPGRPFLAADSIDHLYAAARAAGAVSGHDQCDWDAGKGGRANA